MRLDKAKDGGLEYRGKVGEGVSSKDMSLNVSARGGTGGGAGYAVEFSGQTVRELGIEARFTLFSMAVEFSAFTGLVAVDQSTLDYSQDRTFGPKGMVDCKKCTQYSIFGRGEGISCENILTSEFSIREIRFKGRIDIS